MTEILKLIGVAAYLMSWLIIARALLSWFPDARNNQIVAILYQITDPIIVPIQRLVPRIGMIDISPMIAFLLLQVIAYATGVRSI